LLRQQVATVTSSTELRTWLETHQYSMLIGAHINDQKASLSLKPPFFDAPLGTLVQDIAESELLISDYSGVIFDFLILERPQIHFCFDEESYRKKRSLFLEPQSLDFALYAKTPAELVEAVTSEKWRTGELSQAARRFRNSHLPPHNKSYAAVSVKAIESFLT